MSSTNTDAPQAEAASTLAPPPEKDSVTQFIEALAKLVPADKAHTYLRATPKGLFVQKEFLAALVETYQRWFKQKTGMPNELSQQKCLKRFFTSPNPTLYYLVEAKQCMVGHLIARDLRQPQLLGLPVYLGSVDDTRRIFHARDPLLMCLPNVSIHNTQRGQEFKIKTSRDEWLCTDRTVKEFSRLIQRTPRLSQQFPERSAAIRDGLKCLILALEQARPAKEQQRLLVPHELRDKPVQYICLHTLTFPVQQRNQIAGCYEVGAASIFRFIKTEFAALFANASERRRGPIEILPARNRNLATIHFHRDSFGINPKAFSQFLRSIMREPLERFDMPKRYSVRDALQGLSLVLQSAQRIDRGKVVRHVERIRLRNARYLVNGRWIFVVNRRGVLLHCIDRFHAH